MSESTSANAKQAAKITFKEGVIGPPSAPLSEALSTLGKIYGWFGRAEMMVTALRDGQHEKDSLHPKGYAADVRTIDIPPLHVRAIAATARKMLPGFDVVIESANTPGASAQHLHLEFDPEGNGGANLPAA